jgi:hypothetical protein
MSSDAKGMAESDTDSMAEYGEGDAGKNVVRLHTDDTILSPMLMLLYKRCFFLYVHQVGTPFTVNT